MQLSGRAYTSGGEEAKAAESRRRWLMMLLPHEHEAAATVVAVEAAAAGGRHPLSPSSGTAMPALPPMHLLHLPFQRVLHGAVAKLAWGRQGRGRGRPP